MGQPGIAHRLFVRFGNRSAVAARQGGCDGTGRSFEIGANVSRELSLSGCYGQSGCARRLDDLYIADSRSSCGKPIEPGSSGEVVRTGNDRR